MPRIAARKPKCAQEFADAFDRALLEAASDLMGRCLKVSPKCAGDHHAVLVTAYVVMAYVVMALVYSA